MNAETLFVHRYEEMLTLVESHREIDLLDLSSRLYQMIGDKHSLMDTANRQSLTIRFRATDQPPPPDWLLKLSTIHSYEDSVDPAVVHDTPQAVFVRDLTRDEFLGLKVMWLDGEPITIKHIIGYARNVAGGAHHDPTTQHREYAAIGEKRGQFSVGGTPLGLRQLRAIGLVVLRGLQPLYDEVSKTQSK